MGWWPWSSGDGRNDGRRGDPAHGDRDRDRARGGWDGTSPPPPPPPPPRPGHWQDPRRGEDQHGHRPQHNYEQHQQQHDQRDNYHQQLQQQHHEQPRHHEQYQQQQPHREPCKFVFAPGGCRHGNNCRFSHEGPPPPNPYEPRPDHAQNHMQNHMQNHSMQNQQPQQPMQPRFVPPNAGDRGGPVQGTDEFGRAAPGLHPPPPQQTQTQQQTHTQRRAGPASHPTNNSLDGTVPSNGANDTASGGKGPGNGNETVAPSAARSIVDQIQARINSTAAAPAAAAPAAATIPAAAPVSALRTAGHAGSDKAKGGILKKATVAVATAPPAATGDGAKSAGEAAQGGAGGEHKKTIRFAPTPEKPKRTSPDKAPRMQPTNLNAALNRRALGNSQNLATAHHQPPGAAASKPAPPAKKGPNMCTLHNLEHKWHDCPNNPYSPNFCGIDHRSMNLSTDLAKTAQQLKQPPAVVPAAKGKAAAARAAVANSGMFNTSGAARPAMPRKMASDTALGGGAGRPIPRKAASETALGGGVGSIPKKPKFQHQGQTSEAPSAAQQIVEEVQATLSSPEKQGHAPPEPSQPGQRPPPPPHRAPQTQQRQQQVRRQAPASGLFNTSRAARPVPRKPPASAEAAAAPAAPAGHHEHIQSQQPALSPATKDVVVGYKPGTRGKGRGRGKAPMPTGAIPLQKQRGTRLLAGKKSAFSPRREEGGGEVRPSPSGESLGSSTGGGAAAWDGTPAPVPLAAAAGAGDGGDGSDADKGSGDDMSVSDSDDEPLMRRATVDAKKQDKRVLRSSDDESPPSARKRSPVPPKKKTVEYLDDSTSDDDSSDDDVPLRQRYQKQREQKGEDVTPMENCQKEQLEIPPEPPEQSSDQNDGTETPRVSDDKSDAAEGGEDDNSKGKGGRVDGSDASTGDDSDVDEDDNDDGENGQGSTDMEMEDAVFDDLERDLFQLVDRTIEVQDRWYKRIESQLERLTEDWERHEQQNRASVSNDDLGDDGQANEEQLGHGEPSKDDSVGTGLPSATSANEELGAVEAAPHGRDEVEAGANDQGGDVAEEGLPATPVVAHANDHNKSLASEEERQRVETEKKRRKEEKKAARREKRKLAEKGDGRKAKKQKHGSHSEADADPWTEDEKALFSKGVEECGQNWGKIANEYVKTRDPFQVREYARRLAKNSEVKQHVASASTSAGMAIEVDTGLGAFEPVGDDSRTDEEVDEDSEISDDDIIPGFVTCDKCGLVMMGMDEVWAHEKTCTITPEDRLQGRVFNDKHALMIYILNFCNQMGRQLKEDDMIFFGEDFNPTMPDNTAGLDEGSDAPLQGPPDDASRGDPDKEAEGDDDDEDEEEDEMADMNLVKHLCSTTIDPRTGLPVKKLTVMCGDTETLYDFRVEIKPSNIPGAGYGAFLKYLGARVLNRRAAERSSRLIAEHVIDTSICTRDELMAETLGGRKVTVKLTGDNLHYNDNNIYWSKARSEKYAEYEKEMKRLSASSPRASWSRASTMESFEEDEVLCKVHDEVAKLRKKIPAGQGIGFLGINSHLDYTEDKDKMFWNHPHAFELGRYGPHRPEDRKINLHFDFKNFIHSCEPSEWSYEVPEKMLGHRQIVDITDELTGEVHAEAKKHTPIYVNEVGHNSKLHNNVLIRDKNERSIYYYVSIDEKHAMKKGDEVELLVDYGDHYEQVRERKGYGRVNVSQNVGGDEEDGARLQRNFREREEVENDISSMKVYEMYHLVEFLTEEIFDPIEKSIRRAISDDDGFGTDCNPVMGRQLVARRRLHWIGEKLAGRIQEYVDDPQIVDTSEFISSIRESLQKWQFDSLPKIHPTLNKDLANTLLVELAEELLYKTRSCLPCPLDQTVWSKLAVDLMKRTAQLIAKFLLCYSGAMDLRLQCLGENILKQARSSAEALQKGAKAVNGMGRCPEDMPQELIDLLAFKSRERKLKKKDLLDESSGRMISLYDNDETIRFGAAAAMADIQAYYDAAELCGIEPHFVPGKAGQKLSECGRSIVAQYEPSAAGSDKRSPQFRWMARDIDAFVKGNACVNEQWYLENQVLLVVHLLASNCVDWQTGHDSYSLEKLCGVINLDVQRAKKALDQGAINPTWPEVDVPSAQTGDGSTTKGSRRRRRRRRRQGRKTVHQGLAPTYDGPDPLFSGWNVKSIPRRQSTSRAMDFYWYHPDIEGVEVRSKTGVKALIDYMEKKGVGVREAYEHYQGERKWFKCSTLKTA